MNIYLSNDSYAQQSLTQTTLSSAGAGLNATLHIDIKSESGPCLLVGMMVKRLAFFPLSFIPQGTSLCLMYLGYVMLCDERQYRGRPSARLRYSE